MLAESFKWKFVNFKIIAKTASSSFMVFSFRTTVLYCTVVKNRLGSCFLFKFIFKSYYNFEEHYGRENGHCQFQNKLQIELNLR